MRCGVVRPVLALDCGAASVDQGSCRGAVGSAAGPLLTGLDFESKLVAQTVVGGVAAVAGGGKFENGAVTAAFGYLFNQMAGQQPRS